MFELFVIAGANKKCPEVEYIDSKQTLELLDYDNFKKSYKDNIVYTNKEKITVVIGFWRETANIRDGKKLHIFNKYYVLNAGNKQCFCIQDSKQNDCRLLVMLTTVDKNGNKIEDLKQQIKGAIKVNGYLVRENADSIENKIAYANLFDGLDIPSNNCRLVVFSARFEPDIKAVGLTKKAMNILKKQRTKKLLEDPESTTPT